MKTTTQPTHDPDRWSPEDEPETCANRIRIEGGAVILDFAYPYAIELNRIPNRAALVEWIHHILGKGWMHDPSSKSPELRMRTFIETVCKAKGWKLYGNEAG